MTFSLVFVFKFFSLVFVSLLYQSFFNLLSHSLSCSQCSFRCVKFTTTNKRKMNINKNTYLNRICHACISFRRVSFYHRAPYDSRYISVHLIRLSPSLYFSFFSFRIIIRHSYTNFTNTSIIFLHSLLLVHTLIKIKQKKKNMENKSNIVNRVQTRLKIPFLRFFFYFWFA